MRPWRFCDQSATRHHRDPARREWIDGLVYQMRLQRTLPLRTPVEHRVILLEPDRHRDPDNVYAGAMKLLWDALVVGKYLPADGRAVVGKCRGWEVVQAPRSRAGVWLCLWQPDDPTTVLFSIEGQLPALNEILAARERAGHRRAGAR